ncbi:putative rhamnogalacturonan acetylesterase YesY [mine drainage metagenome]|uniref:Putative rhamnogalacturonan acetylesterase YesY n=1 Tax=mine drainage metagenome TaxID=410659 RepID=A0A1J5RSP9_9ZZZZ
MNPLRFTRLLGTAALLAMTGLGLHASTSIHDPDLKHNPPPGDYPHNLRLPSVFIASDSTAANYGGHPIQGWGAPFHDYFDPSKVNIVNLARGGRSSRTYITEGLWDKLLSQVKGGDYVLIQFGHNDAGAINAEPPGSKMPLRARGSLPGIGDESVAIDNVLTGKHEIVHTFGWYLRKMIRDVRMRSATPIILSLTVRDIWKDGKVERGAGHYREWDREVAQEEGVDFVDLTRIVADKYQEMGEAKVKTLFPRDHTHTGIEGADINAAAVVSGLKGIRGGPWDHWLSAKGLEVPADPLVWLNLPEPANPKIPTLMIIGDSTVRNGRGDGRGGQWGWGDELSPYFDLSKINVCNRAVGGTSSRSFINLGFWERVRTLLKPGDFLLMQFGHNDAGPLNDTSRARGTIRGVGDESEAIDNLLTKKHEVVHTYGWYLRKYIREAKAMGVTPIVCSQIPRMIWKDGKIVRSDNSYSGWAREVAQQEGVAFIPLNELIAERYDAMGPEKVLTMFGDPHTHTSLIGARLNASIVAGVLAKLPGDPFAPYLRKP